MRFRTYLFSCLSCGMLTLVAAICALYATQSYSSDAEFVGGIVGFLCWSAVPVIGAVLFALTAWRNAAGLKAEARHAELIQTLRGKSHDGA